MSEGDEFPYPLFISQSLGGLSQNKLLHGLSFCGIVAKNLFLIKYFWYKETLTNSIFYGCCVIIVASIFPCVIPENKFKGENLLS